MSISRATDTIFQLSRIEYSGLSEANMTWERGRCLVRGWTEMSGGAQNEPEAPSTTLSFPHEPSPLKRCTSMTAPQDAQRWDGRWPWEDKRVRRHGLDQTQGSAASRRVRTGNTSRYMTITPHQFPWHTYLPVLHLPIARVQSQRCSVALAMGRAKQMNLRSTIYKIDT